MSNDDRSSHGLVSIAMPVDKVTKPVFGKHGFAGGALVVDWPAIVGSAVASHTIPLSIRFPPQDRSEGTLVIKVASSAFATQLQHLAPLILERINGYFGWKAVARLKLVHGPLPKPKQAKAAAAVAEAEPSEAVAKALEQVDDPALREVLERIGRRIAATRT